ncbi:uncharacterized protein B0I36DRAFT_354103 [Microdochium trichocladiopsis]|uniref:Uncharacterized protein n=1 Tax=Microdochium trichocladiopsis TaxID=1682393 RepID=A0A9P9BL88_9PEZI|nr:uncharacterized protein B0I36DRAFT_354103 [Microdochium trichocladiopsis]KAH7021447.1 hypothetical protein B0I36DRAFT_354103 [Microdochium trichocladiopsis]
MNIEECSSQEATMGNFRPSGMPSPSAFIYVSRGPFSVQLVHLTTAPLRMQPANIETPFSGAAGATMEDNRDVRPNTLDRDFVARDQAFRPDPAIERARATLNPPPPETFEKSVFARPLSNIRVLKEESLTAGAPLLWQPLFDDALEPVRPIANLPATNPPLSRMVVYIADIHHSDCWQDWDLMDQRPAPLVIDNSGENGGAGRSITVVQFVREVSAYAETEPLRRAIVGIFWPRPGRSSDGAWFDGCAGPERSRATAPDVLFWVGFTIGVDEAKMAEHWASARDCMLRREATA